MKIEFSIIIPTYNRADFISKTIRSVLSQSYQNFELIIVDDGSTDNTEEVVRGIVDKRIKYYKKLNEERAIARNFGIERAAGKYITLLDSDDILYTHHLQTATQIIEEKNPELFHLGYEIKSENGKIIRKVNNRKGNLNDSLITGNHLSCIGVFIKNEIAKETRFNEDLEIIGSEDYELWLRLASKYQLHYSNEITSCMNQHADRSVTNFDSGKLITRINKLIQIVIKNTSWNPSEIKRFVVHRYLYLSLHLAMNNNRKLAIQFLVKALTYYPILFLSRKSFGILKNLP